MGVIKTKTSDQGYAPYQTSTPAKKFRSVIVASSSPISCNTSADSSITSSVFSPIRSTALNKKERQLEVEIKKYEKRKDLILKSIRYQENNEFEKINKLISKWKNASQLASNYLLNAFQLKISGMGGTKEWKRSIKKKEYAKKSYINDELLERLETYMESDEFKDLSKLEKKDIIDQYNDNKKQFDEQEFIADSDEDVIEDSNLTMKQLYEYLKLDYDLVFSD